MRMLVEARRAAAALDARSDRRVRRRAQRHADVRFRFARASRGRDPAECRRRCRAARAPRSARCRASPRSRASRAAHVLRSARRLRHRGGTAALPRRMPCAAARAAESFSAPQASAPNEPVHAARASRSPRAVWPHPKQRARAADCRSCRESPPRDTADVAESRCRRAAHSAAARSVAPPRRSQWDDLQDRRRPRSCKRYRARFRTRRWPWVVAIVLALIAVGVFFVHARSTAPPRAGEAASPAHPHPAVADTPSASAPRRAAVADRPARSARATCARAGPGEQRCCRVRDAPSAPSAAVESPVEDAGRRRGRSEADSAKRSTRRATTFDQRLAALEARGAGFWGGPDFALGQDARRRGRRRQ